MAAPRRRVLRILLLLSPTSADSSTPTQALGHLEVENEPPRIQSCQAHDSEDQVPKSFRIIGDSSLTNHAQIA